MFMQISEYLFMHMPLHRPTIHALVGASTHAAFCAVFSIHAASIMHTDSSSIKRMADQHLMLCPLASLIQECFS